MHVEVHLQKAVLLSRLRSELMIKGPVAVTERGFAYCSTDAEEIRYAAIG